MLQWYLRGNPRKKSKTVNLKKNVKREGEKGGTGSISIK